MVYFAPHNGKVGSLAAECCVGTISIRNLLRYFALIDPGSYRLVLSYELPIYNETFTDPSYGDTELVAVDNADGFSDVTGSVDFVLEVWDGEPDEGWEIAIECVWVERFGLLPGIMHRDTVNWESLAYKGEDLNELLITAAIVEAKKEDSDE